MIAVNFIEVVVVGVIVSVVARIHVSTISERMSETNGGSDNDVPNGSDGLSGQSDDDGGSSGADGDGDGDGDGGAGDLLRRR